MSTVLNFALVDVVAEATGQSKNKIRKAILRGRVEVNGLIVRDPDMRVGGHDLVRVDQSVPVRPQ